MKRFVKKQKFLIVILAIAIIGANLAGYVGAYFLTHYQQPNGKGFGFPRSANHKLPKEAGLNYTSKRIEINNHEWLDTWLVQPYYSDSQGTVILFHGKASNKSSLLSSAKVFQELGYHILLVDFRGAGKSSGHKTTIGVKESEDVVAAMKYAQKISPQQPIFLYGISMGSAAILRAIAKHDIEPDGIILELPFASLLNAIRTRLARSKVPTFPLAELFVFWGGLQHGFNGFAHNPVDYAQKVKSPVLIMYGSRDRTIAQADIEALFQNFNTDKNLVAFPDAGHELLVKADRQLWKKNVREFLDNVKH